MSEELRVDGALGNGTAVDGKILLTPTRRVIVNHSGNNLLTYSALSDNEHTEVGWRHLQSDVERMVQCIAVAHDIVPLFDSLKF